MSYALEKFGDADLMLRRGPHVMAVRLDEAWTENLHLVDLSEIPDRLRPAFAEIRDALGGALTLSDQRANEIAAKVQWIYEELQKGEE